METFQAWIKLRLPDEVFRALPTDCPNLLALVFQQLATSDDDDNLQTAVNVVVELITLSRKSSFVEIKAYVLTNLDSLQAQVVKVLQDGDVERADLFSEVFSELALSHVDQIVNEGSPILQILLQLQQVPDSKFGN